MRRFLAILLAAAALTPLAYFTGIRSAHAVPTPPCKMSCICRPVSSWAVIGKNAEGPWMYYTKDPNDNNTVSTNAIGGITTNNQCSAGLPGNGLITIYKTAGYGDIQCSVTIGSVNDSALIECNVPTPVLFPPNDPPGFTQQICR